MTAPRSALDVGLAGSLTEPSMPLLSGAGNELLETRGLSKLRWRCRRGLLENDLFIDRFFAQHESGLTVRHAAGLAQLMDLADNDLLDLLLLRTQPDSELACPEVMEVLSMLRAKPTVSCG